MTERLSYRDNMCADSDMGHTQTYIRFRLFMGKRQIGANTEALSSCGIFRTHRGFNHPGLPCLCACPDLIFQHQ